MPGDRDMASRDGRHDSRDRRARLKRGLFSEWIAALLLMVKGYRILGRRVRTPHGEVDLIACRGQRLAFVEVKRRRTLSDAAAAITPLQSERIARAAEHWISRRPRYGDHELGLDIVLVAPWRWPRHRENAL